MTIIDDDTTDDTQPDAYPDADDAPPEPHTADELDAMQAAAVYSKSASVRVIARRVRRDFATACKHLTPAEVQQVATDHYAQADAELALAVGDEIDTAHRMLDRARAENHPRKRLDLARAARRLLQRRVDDHEGEHALCVEDRVDEVAALVTICDGEFPAARPAGVKPLVRPGDKRRPKPRRPQVQR